MIAVGADGPRVQPYARWKLEKGFSPSLRQKPESRGKGNGCIPAPYHVQGKLSRE